MAISHNLTNISIPMESLLIMLLILSSVGTIICFILSISAVRKHNICKCRNHKTYKKQMQNEWLSKIKWITITHLILLTSNQITYTCIVLIRLFCSKDSDIIDRVCSVQIIIFHLSKMALFALLSSRLWILYIQTNVLFTILTIANTFYIMSYSLILILFSNQFDLGIIDQSNTLLAFGYILDILMIALMSCLYISSYIKLLMHSQRQIIHKKSLTSVFNDNIHRETMNTLLSLPTSADTDDCSSSNAYALSAIPSEDTYEYNQARPPLDLHVTGSSQQKAIDETEINLSDFMSILAVGHIAGLHTFTKYTSLCAISLIPTLIAVSLLFLIQLIEEFVDFDSDPKWVMNEFGYFAVCMYCFISCIVTYLGIKDNSKEYRRCCTNCDTLCQKIWWKYATWKLKKEDGRDSDMAYRKL